MSGSVSSWIAWSKLPVERPARPTPSPTAATPVPRASQRRVARRFLRVIPQLREQRGQRPLEVLDRAVVGDHVLGPRRLLVLAELARLALVDQGVAAGAARSRRTSSAVTIATVVSKTAIHLRLEQQRHLDHGDLGLRRQTGQPGADPLADQRMDLPLEPGQLLGIGEDDLADPVAVDPAPGRDLRAPALDQARRAAARNRAARGRRRRWRGSPRPSRSEGRQRLGLPGRDAAGEADRQRHRTLGVGGCLSSGVSASASGAPRQPRPRQAPRLRGSSASGSSATGSSAAASSGSSASGSSDGLRPTFGLRRLLRGWRGGWLLARNL